MAIDEDKLNKFDSWATESLRIDNLYEGLRPSEIRDLVRQYCEALVGSMSISDIIQMGDEGTYDHMFHIDLDNLPENDKKYEVDIVLDYKHDLRTYQQDVGEFDA